MPLNVAYTIKVAAVTAAGIGNYSESSMPVTPGNTEIAVMQLSGEQLMSPTERKVDRLRVQWNQGQAIEGHFVRYDLYVWPVNSERPSKPLPRSAADVTDETFAPESREKSIIRTVDIRDASDPLEAFIPQAVEDEPWVERAESYNLMVVTVILPEGSEEEVIEPKTNVNVASGVQLGLGVPGRPRNGVLEADGQQLRVAWSEPTSDGGAPVTHYMIRKAGEDAPPCEAVQHDSAALSGEIDESWSYSLNDVSALIYQQSGLTAGSNYEIAVFACNEIGASVPAILTHSIPAPPAPFVPVPPVVPEPEPEPEVEAEPETEIPSGQGKEDEDKKPSKNPTPKPSPSPSDLLNPEVGGTDDSGSDVSQELPGAPETEEQDSAEAEAETQEETLTGSGERPDSENNPQPLLLWGLLLLLIVALRVSQKIQNRSKA
jgi:hypothetical protein